MNDQTPQATWQSEPWTRSRTRTGAEISAALVDAVTRLTEAFERVRRPRQPLGILPL
jgi:hypothetical protein